MQEVHEKLENLQKKVIENIYTQENEDGLLIGKLEDYIKCLKLENVKFDQLLQKDESYWMRNANHEKKLAKKTEDEWQNWLAKGQAKLDE